MYFVYVLKCADKTFYTGITGNLQRRLIAHQNRESPSTKRKLPVSLVYYETLTSRIEARNREIIIKDMSQKRKLELIMKFTSSVSEKRE